MPVELTVDQQSVKAVGDALKAEADGKALRRDLLRQMRTAAAPAVPDVQAAVHALPGTMVASPGLRDAVASQVKVDARLSGHYTGVRVRIGTKKDPRGFKFAGRKMNRRRGWNHPVFGNREVWVNQTEGSEWFETTVAKRRDEVRAAVLDAVNAMAQRIADRVNKETPKP